jgi:uncharacterized protein YdhG (YjbR/CyaY superfamily)
MSPVKTTKRATKSSSVWTEEERAAAKEMARERKRGSANGESDVLAKIAAMHGSDRALAERLHELIKATAPELEPRTYYGMPAYAKEGKVLCWFQDARKFKSRYATLGFSDKANLDDGAMWPVAFALEALTATEEAKIVALLTRALGQG